MQRLSDVYLYISKPYLNIRLSTNRPDALSGHTTCILHITSTGMCFYLHLKSFVEI